MGRKIKYSDKFKSRPRKTAGKRRQRVKAQKRRLIAGGWKPDRVALLGVLATREALKSLER